MDSNTPNPDHPLSPTSGVFHSWPRLMLGSLFLGMLALMVDLVFPLAFDVVQPPTWNLLTHLFIMLGLGIPLFYMLLFLPLTKKLRDNDWAFACAARLNGRMRGIGDAGSLSQAALDFLAEYTQAQIGAIYLYDEESQTLDLAAGHGLPSGREVARTLKPGEGMVGQAALEQKPIVLKNIQTEGFSIDTGAVALRPQSLIVAPLLQNEQLRGILVLGSVYPFSHAHSRLLERAMGSIAVAIGGIAAALRNRALLDQTQKQKDELTQHQLMLKESIQELEQASRYKSRFLASMSHELRSPLNSLLILSKLLSENRDGNLTDKQIEFAQTIHAAGSDLLALIDEVLDLARIEAGRVRIYLDRVELAELVDGIDRLFRHVARDKGLGFRVTMKEGLPTAIRTDRQRVEQILKNLLSNALKFTEQGAVTLDVSPWRSENGAAPPSVSLDPEGEERIPHQWIVLSVTDTGIGIPLEQLKLIFEPFRQVEAENSRKYGGTGLGLAICQELSNLLKGGVSVESTPGEGSVFSLFLPGKEAPLPEVKPETGGESADDTLQDTDLDSIRDDRRRLRPHDKSVLIIGNDHNLVRMEHEIIQGFGLGVVVSGDLSSALFLAKFFQPVSAVLASPLPGVDSGELIQRVRRAVGKERLPFLLLDNPAFISVSLPATTTISIADGQERIQQESRQFLESAITQPKELEEQADGQISEDALAEDRADGGRGAPPQDIALEDLEGRRILIVEDDMRNIFALTSLLEGQKAQVLMAKDGLIGLQMLEESPDIDIILLDIMMPNMDGYQVLREIRRKEAFKELPILVLTARAMQGERSRCIAAGASDYLPKPIDSEKLLAMIQTWLSTSDRLP